MKDRNPGMEMSSRKFSGMMLRAGWRRGVSECGYLRTGRICVQV